MVISEGDQGAERVQDHNGEWWHVSRRPQMLPVNVLTSPSAIVHPRLSISLIKGLGLGYACTNKELQ